MTPKPPPPEGNWRLDQKLRITERLAASLRDLRADVKVQHSTVDLLRQ